MPLVHAYTRHFNDVPGVLAVACREIVAAALHSETGEGQLTPNDIIVLEQHSEEIESDILLVIEAFPYPERLANIDERAEKIMSFLSESIFGHRYTFAVAITPLLAWTSTTVTTDTTFEGSMSMHAALDRALRQIEKRRAHYERHHPRR